MDLRFVIDTNTLVSRMLMPESIPVKAVSYSLENGKILISDDTLMEIGEILSREKLDRYVSIEDRQEFIRLLARISENVEIIRRVKACRDPKDDKFLELAVNGDADTIITGEKDLLVLNPFENIRIIKPADVID